MEKSIGSQARLWAWLYNLAYSYLRCRVAQVVASWWAGRLIAAVLLKKNLPALAVLVCLCPASCWEDASLNQLDIWFCWINIALICWSIIWVLILFVVDISTWSNLDSPPSSECTFQEQHSSVPLWIKLIKLNCISFATPELLHSQKTKQKVGVCSAVVDVRLK